MTTTFWIECISLQDKIRVLKWLREEGIEYGREDGDIWASTTPDVIADLFERFSKHYAEVTFICVLDSDGTALLTLSSVDLPSEN